MTEATQEQVNALSENVGNLTEAVKQLSGEQVQTNTMLRSHLSEQRNRNDRLDRIIDQHSREITDLQKFQVRIEATTPNRLIDGDVIEKRLKSQDDAIAKINITIARWGGGIALVVVIVKAAPSLFNLIF